MDARPEKDEREVHEGSIAKVRILNVEDSARDSELVKLQLEHNGIPCDLVRVETESELVEALSRSEFDLVIADFTLPSFDGQHSLEIARKLCPETPFIFFSGTLGEEAAVDSLKNGATDYILKQRPARLASAVQRALQAAVAQRQGKQIMAALRESESQLRLIAETVDVALWVVNPSADSIIYLSPGYQGIWRENWEHSEGVLRNFPGCVHPDDQNWVFAERQAKRWHSPLDQRYRILDREGATKWIWERGFPVQDSFGQTSRYVGVAKDITEAKRLENALRQTQEELSLKNKIANIFLTAPSSSMFGDVLRTVLDVTQSQDGVIGYVDQDGTLVCSAALQAASQPRVAARFSREQWANLWAGLVDKGSVVTNRGGSFLPVGHVPIHRLLVSPILYQNEIIGHLAVANKSSDYEERDVRLLEHLAAYVAPVLKVRLQRDARETELSQAVAAKEALLQEVHHRVKNNLQIISSLLSIQAKSAPEPTRAILQDSQMRVTVMASVHELLHKGGDTGDLDFANYAKKLTIDLQKVYQPDPGRIVLRFEMEPVRLGVNQAIPCGLILNELVTNALKYAFPGSRKGEIVIAVQRNNQEEIKLQVIDNGIGLPQDFSSKRGSTLGFQIVEVLARQLSGAFHYATEKGLACTLTFPREEVKAPEASLGANAA